MAVLSREDDKFVDNTKYFLLQSSSELPAGIECAYITRRGDIAQLLNEAGYKALLFPSWRCFYFLLRAGSVVVDEESGWASRLRGYCLAGAKLVQLWHGVGFKRIGLDKNRHEAGAKRWLSLPPVLAVRRFGLAMRGFRTRYDIFNVTSQFYRDNVFEPAFISRYFLIAGYPRNGFGENLSASAEELAWSTVDASVRKSLPLWRRNARRIVIVAPTFRDSRNTPLHLSPQNIAALDDWCDNHQVEIVFKFHPYETAIECIQGRHLHICASDSDIYPLMPFTEALVTDYSSIYMDYLLVDKPILFLTPDLEQYIRSDRQIQFDYNEMTPGPKVRTWPGLMGQLERQWVSDEYSQMREQLKAMAFDNLPQGDAVGKILGFMFEQKWLATRRNSSGLSRQGGRYRG